MNTERLKELKFTSWCIDNATSIYVFTLIIVFLIYGFAQVDWTSSTDSKYTIDLSRLSQVDYSKIFNNNFVNAFMMVNVLLVLVLLDRVLANKRKKFQKQA